MSYAPTQEQRWDHARDLRKAEPRFGDNKGRELLSIVEGLLSVQEFADQFPLTCALFRETAERYRRDNGMEARQ